MTTKTKTKTAKKTATSKPRRAKPASNVPARESGTSIIGLAMLANVNIRMWEGRKHDREVTERVNADHHATPDAGRYHKHLFGGGVPELGAILTAATQLRITHYAHTLPWSDTGFRLLPTENYLTYVEEMRKGRARFDEAVEAFVSAYPRLKRAAAERLQSMYRETDYPPASLVKDRYRVQLEFAPIPTGEDFRVALPEKELARMAKEVEARVTSAAQLAMADVWKRLGDAVSHLRERLDDGKHLRDSMITKLKDVATGLGRLNLTQDPTLEDVRGRVLTTLATLDAKTLREDDDVRAGAAQQADSILTAMAGLYAPAKEA